MLKKGLCPVNAQDLNGNTALHQAASRGFVEVVHLLVRLACASVSTKNLDGLTPLHLALEGGFVSVMEASKYN